MGSPAASSDAMPAGTPADDWPSSVPGVMGETVLSGLLRAGWDPDRIVATDRRPERQVELREKYGITMLENPRRRPRPTP